MNIVLMAGGGGTRLWPLSREGNPKQFLDLGTGKTLLEHTYKRARMLAEPRNIFVATVEEFRERIRKLLPDVPVDNMFFEPERRDTGPAFAAVAVRLKLKGKADEPTIFMWSDHVFTDEDEFVSDLGKVPTLIEKYPDTVIIIGHRPTTPETGLGYLERGDAVEGYDDVYWVKSFREKPDAATAEQYVAAGTFFWNMGYISLTPTYLLGQLREHEPKLMAGVEEFGEALRDQDPKRAAAQYAKLPKIAIDYALLEKTTKIIAVTGDYGWSDVGSWATVHDIFGTSGDHVPKGHHIHVDSHNNYVYNATEKAVSLIGMKDTIVVVTEDAILVSDRSKAQKVKDVVQRLKEEGKSEYL